MQTDQFRTCRAQGVLRLDLPTPQTVKDLFILLAQAVAGHPFTGAYQN